MFGLRTAWSRMAGPNATGLANTITIATAVMGGAAAYVKISDTAERERVLLETQQRLGAAERDLEHARTMRRLTEAENTRLWAKLGAERKP